METLTVITKISTYMLYKSFFCTPNELFYLGSHVKNIFGERGKCDDSHTTKLNSQNYGIILKNVVEIFSTVNLTSGLNFFCVLEKIYFQTLTSICK